MGRYDVAVVGCGGMGASASFHLARRGLKTVTLEQFGLNHPFGSSHGRTRIIRTAYYEDPRYVPLLRRAFQGWEALQRLSGKRIISMTGGLMIGEPDAPLISGARRSAVEHHLDHELLSHAEVRDRYPFFEVAEDEVAVFEKGAGVLFPETCVGEYVSAAEAVGCEFKFGEGVRRWRRAGDGFEVETDVASYSADSLVFTPGPWMGKLLPGVVKLSCERQVPFWFRPRKEGSLGADSMPIFMSEEKGQFFYGIPDFGDGVKVAVHHGGETVDPNRVNRTVTERDRRPVKEFVRRRLTGLFPDPTDSTTCIYTNTSDGNFVVDSLPDLGGAFLVSACSGHGFKFASVMGEIVADLVEEGRTKMDVGFLGLGRFAGSSA